MNDIGVLSIKKILADLALGLPIKRELLIVWCNKIFKNQYVNEYILNCLHELENTDEYTYKHSVNVGFYSMLLAKWLKLSEEEILSATQAGLLHDIGKTLVDKRVLNKTGRLTKEEFEEIKLHSVHGFNILKDTEGISYDVKKTILMHHEREDGSGYPLQSKSHMINLYTKIVAITDVFDAMTSDRVYKNGVTPFEAFEMFRTTGISLFDPDYVNTFMNNLATYYTGTKIRLSSGKLGEVMYIPPNDITNPVILYESKYIKLSSFFTAN